MNDALISFVSQAHHPSAVPSASPALALLLLVLCGNLRESAGALEVRLRRWRAKLRFAHLARPAGVWAASPRFWRQCADNPFSGLLESHTTGAAFA